jgi:serine phosphatase RsbU (regulator of sigma subunit)
MKNLEGISQVFLKYFQEQIREDQELIRKISESIMKRNSTYADRYNENIREAEKRIKYYRNQIEKWQGTI